jgi:MltA-interacting protein MipA
MGLRHVTQSGWTMGVFATVQTDGFGPDTSDALLGMQKRGWTVGLGPVVGYRLGPVRADLFAATDILKEHGGQAYNLKLAWPFPSPRLEIVPQLEATRYSSDYVDHYYGVAADEATATRPEWHPGAATVYTAGIHLAWRFSRNWYLRAALNFDRLPDAIAGSPIVNVRTAWRGGIGLAYDTANFIAPDYADDLSGYSELDAAVEFFFMQAKSRVVLSGSGPSQTLRLESSSNLEDRKLAIPVTLTWRLGRFQTLGMRYFELYRDGGTELVQTRVIGGQTFAAGEKLETSLATRVLRIAYGFAVFRDQQKELVVSGGLHATRFEYRASTADSERGAATNAILPLLGAQLRASFTEQLALHVSAEMFFLDFDQYSGKLIDIAAAGRYRLGSPFSVEAGYRYYRQTLDSNDDSLIGSLRFDYRGPFLALTATFR